MRNPSNLKKRSRGYFLYELCLVLTLIGSLYLLIKFPTYETDESKLTAFITTFENDLNYVKLHSAATGERFDLYFSQTSPSYSIRRSLQTIDTRSYDDSITIIKHFNDHRIVVVAGMVESDGMMTICVGEKCKTLHVEAKGGVLRVQEQTRPVSMRGAFVPCIDLHSNYPHPFGIHRTPKADQADSGRRGNDAGTDSDHSETFKRRGYRMG